MWPRRPDGRLARDVPPYRALMPLLMPTRNESAVYFDLEVDLARTEPFLAAWSAANPDAKATLFHVVAWAAARVLHRRPWLNRFVAGGRIWDRDGIWLSFAAKRKLDDAAPLVTIKRRFDPAWSFAEVVRAITGDVKDGRGPGETATEREVRVLGWLPRFVLRPLYAVFRWLDGVGLAPRLMIEPDPLYTSMFLANLGSIGLDAAYHHLYEHGTASIFCVLGKTRQVPVVVGGAVQARRTAVLRFTYDERVADGLYAQRALDLLRRTVEDPANPPEE